LLTEGFTDEELRRLCYDVLDFRPVYDQLAQDTGKAKIIDRLIEHADRKLQMETLLTWAKKRNPTRYEKHQPYYDTTINYVTPTFADTTHQSAVKSEPNQQRSIASPERNKSISASAVKSKETSRSDPIVRIQRAIQDLEIIIRNAETDTNITVTSSNFQKWKEHTTNLVREIFNEKEALQFSSLYAPDFVRGKQPRLIFEAKLCHKHLRSIVDRLTFHNDSQAR
jgi:hypothetical protein